VTLNVDYITLNKPLIYQAILFTAVCATIYFAAQICFRLVYVIGYQDAESEYKARMLMANNGAKTNE